MAATQNASASSGIPSAEMLLATLIDLYADQMGVKVKYEMTDYEEGAKEDAGR